MFILVYLALVLTFGFTLLTTDIAIGRKTGRSALSAFGAIRPKWDFLGKMTFLVPTLIMTYYTVIGGWVTKYVAVYLTGAGADAAQDGYFVGFITSPVGSIAFMLLFLAVTAIVVYCGVEKGIEKILHRRHALAAGCDGLHLQFLPHAPDLPADLSAHRMDREALLDRRGDGTGRMPFRT